MIPKSKFITFLSFSCQQPESPMCPINNVHIIYKSPSLFSVQLFSVWPLIVRINSEDRTLGHPI